MKRLCFTLTFACALSTVAAAAAPLKVPLEYEAYGADEARIIVHAIRVASFDMLAEPERDAPRVVSFGKDACADGMRLAKTEWAQAPESKTVGDKDCGVSTRPIPLKVDEGWADEPADGRHSGGIHRGPYAAGVRG